MACENDVPPISIDEARETTPFSATKNFRYIALGNVPNSRLTEIMSGLEDKRPNVLEFFGVSEMPVVTVMIWQSRSDFERAYGENNPSVRGFIGAEDWEIHVFNTERNPVRGVVHEFSHLVQLVINPTISSNPKWLWEALATYVSRTPPASPPESLACISMY